jgi:uncharacterized membrane protein
MDFLIKLIKFIFVILAIFAIAIAGSMAGFVGGFVTFAIIMFGVSIFND